MCGVDPTVFRRYFHEEIEEVEDEVTEVVSDKRSEVKDYKMPRRKTTRRKKKKDCGDDDDDEKPADGEAEATKEDKPLALPSESNPAESAAAEGAAAAASGAAATPPPPAASERHVDKKSSI